jgi:hypothetical protein
MVLYPTAGNVDNFILSSTYTGLFEMIVGFMLQTVRNEPDCRDYVRRITKGAHIENL